MATNAAAQNAIKKKLVHKLEVRCWARICKGQASTVSEQGLSRSPHTTPLSRGVMSFASTVSMLLHREISLPLCALCCFGVLEMLGCRRKEVHKRSSLGDLGPGHGSGAQYKLSVLTCASLCQHAAKQAAASATQTIAAAQHASSSNKNPAAQQQLVQSCKVRAWA